VAFYWGVDPGTHVAFVRIKFDDAIVDNKGGSRTTTLTEAEPYDAFFREFDSARPRAKRTRHGVMSLRSCPTIVRHSKEIRRYRQSAKAMNRVAIS
jgi:hypothetical protein